MAIIKPTIASLEAFPPVMYQVTIEQRTPRHVPRILADPVVLDAPIVMEHTNIYERRPHSPLQNK
jgi:hypothetical protein